MTAQPTPRTLRDWPKALRARAREFERRAEAVRRARDAVRSGTCHLPGGECIPVRDHPNAEAFLEMYADLVRDVPGMPPRWIESFALFLEEQTIALGYRKPGRHLTAIYPVNGAARRKDYFPALRWVDSGEADDPEAPVSSEKSAVKPDPISEAEPLDSDEPVIPEDLSSAAEHLGSTETPRFEEPLSKVQPVTWIELGEDAPQSA